jgi:hypothetical protein
MKVDNSVSKFIQTLFYFARICALQFARSEEHNSITIKAQLVNATFIDCFHNGCILD